MPERTGAKRHKQELKEQGHKRDVVDQYVTAVDKVSRLAVTIENPFVQFMTYTIEVGDEVFVTYSQDLRLGASQRVVIGSRGSDISYQFSRARTLPEINRSIVDAQREKSISEIRLTLPRMMDLVQFIKNPQLNVDLLRFIRE